MFRDANPPLNSHMSSYSLKTVVMHLRDDIGDDSSDLWKLNRLHEVFLKALEKMQDYMDPSNHE